MWKTPISYDYLKRHIFSLLIAFLFIFLICSFEINTIKFDTFNFYYLNDIFRKFISFLWTNLKDRENFKLKFLNLIIVKIRSSGSFHLIVRKTPLTHAFNLAFHIKTEWCIYKLTMLLLIKKTLFCFLFYEKQTKLYIYF